MKISTRNIYEFCIYSIIFLNLGFLDVFGALDRQAMFVSILLGIFAFFIYIFDSNRRAIKRGKDLVVGIFLILCVFILQMFRIQNDGINPRAAFITFGGMLLGLATFPMYELLMTQFKRTIKYIVNIGFAAMILRIILWFFYNFFHINLGRGFFEGREDWTRTILGFSLVRISEPYISGFLFIICILGIYNRGYFKKKSSNLIGIALLYFYAIFVSQTRMQLLVYTIILGLMILIQALNSKKIGIFVLSVIAILMLILFNREHIISFFNSFDPNSVNGYSTTVRINSFNYFFTEWENSSRWLGFGFTPDGHAVGLNKYWISDFGIYINLFEFGILGFLILIYPLIKGIVVSLKSFKIGAFYSNLFIGLTLFLLISLENIYLLNLSTIVPIYFGLMLLVENRKLISRNKHENISNNSNI